jgi:hypothetical protein
MMKKKNNIFKYVLVYGFWFVDLGLATWFLFRSRLVLLIIPALLFDPTDYFYPKRAEVVDKFFTLLLGIVWLSFMVISEEYFRASVLKGKLIKRITWVTGSLLFGILIVESILRFGLF